MRTLAALLAVLAACSGGDISLGGYDASGTQVDAPAAPVDAVVIDTVVDAVTVDAVIDAVTVDAPIDAVLVDAAIDTVAGPVNLLVVKSGTGSGIVVSSPAGINCGALCAATFPVGVVVTLTAVPAAGSHFVGWTGPTCPSSSPTCTEVMDTTITVQAQFDAP